MKDFHKKQNYLYLIYLVCSKSSGRISERDAVGNLHSDFFKLGVLNYLLQVARVFFSL